jgi:hypothetical protein
VVRLFNFLPIEAFFNKRLHESLIKLIKNQIRII